MIIYLDENYILQNININDVIGFVRDCLKSNYKSKSVTPPRSLIFSERPFAVFGAMSSLSKDLGIYVTKTASFVDSSSSHKSSVNSIVTVFCGKTGKPKALINGEAVTHLKCATLAALAVKYCTPKNIRNMVIIGSGKIAWSQIVGICAVRDIENINIYNRTKIKAEEFSRKIATQFKETKTTVFENINGALDNSQLIATSTSSNVPIIRKIISEPYHINCMGGHSVDAREVDASILMSSLLIVEDRDTAVREAGKLHANAIEFEELINKNDFSFSNTVFSSTGHAFFDLCISKYILDKLSKDTM